MKPWRERIAEARERGQFTADDTRDWCFPSQCFVGEMRERYDLPFNLEMTGLGLGTCMSGPLQAEICVALYHNNFDAAECLLDYVEDRALQLKREAQETKP